VALKKPNWTFVQFCDVIGFALTPGQLVLAKVIFDGVEPRDLNGAERELASKIFGDAEVIPSLARAVALAVCGGRSGKTRLSAVYTAWRMVTADVSMLAPGERAVALIVAPDLKLGRQNLSFVIGVLKSVQLFEKWIVAETADSITIKRPDSAVIACEVLAATRGGSAVRGRSLICATLEELAFFRDDTAIVNDEEIYRAVAPRVMDGGLLLGITTAWAQVGLAWSLWRDNFGKPETCIVAHAPTLLMNPAKAAEVEREYKRNPVNADREFGAVFAASDEALLTPGDVDALVDTGVVARLPSKQADGFPVKYVIGLDVGLRHDRSAVIVGHHAKSHADPSRDPIVIDHVEHITPAQHGGRISLDTVEAAVIKLSQRYNRAVVHHDSHLADALAPRLKAKGVKCVEVKMASGVQAERASLLVQRARTGLLRLVDHEALIEELKGLRLTRHSGGRVTIAAEKKKTAHDDLADALLLCLAACAELPAAVTADALTPAELQEAFFERLDKRRRFEAATGYVAAHLMTQDEIDRRQLDEIHFELSYAINEAQRNK
jgi:hypothetical protein